MGVSSLSPTQQSTHRTSVSRSRLSRTHSGHTLFSSLDLETFTRSDDSDKNNFPDWELLYQEGERAKQVAVMAKARSSSLLQGRGTSPQSQDEISQHQFSSHYVPVRVVTFDLDNTLWKTSGTIDAANDALAAYLDSKQITVSRRIEKVMGELFQADRHRYCPLCSEDCSGNSDAAFDSCCKAPVLLTQLRTDAIAYVMETENDFPPSEALESAQEAFEVWTQARHDAIVDNLAPDVVTTLHRIRTELNTPSSSTSERGATSVIIGAITDGNSNPGRVDVLKPYFDFVVNAESVGVGKPDRRVYHEAVKQIVRHPHFGDIVSSVSDSSFDAATGNEDAIESIVGPYWCHVGDDFLKDVVAAKNMRMRSIWAIGLVRDKLNTEHEKTTNTTKYESLDVGEFVKKVAEQKVISMGIGADDYLATSLTGEFADAIANDFSAIANILIDWHQTVGAEADPSTTSIAPTVAASANGEINIAEFQSQSPKTNITQLPVAIVNSSSDDGMNVVLPRAFRLVREECSMDVPAPLRNRTDRTMKDVMTMAQVDKTSGVFAFPLEDIELLRQGKKVLMIQVGSTGLSFSKEIFSTMSIEDIIGMTDDNPVMLSMFMKNATEKESFDLF